jgi:2-aminoadipate transaminase
LLRFDGVDPRIERLQRRMAVTPGVISFGGGLPDERWFPRRMLARSFEAAVRSPALQYGWPEGSEALRRFVSKRLQMRGAAVEPGDVIVTSGAQQAIAIAASLATAGGGAISVGETSYPGALDLFRSRGFTPRPDGGAARYAMPALHNPTGLAQPRPPLLGEGVPLLEDDAYAELRFDGRFPRPLVADAPERVWHVGTFSKTLCPGLRVGWLVPPRRWFRRSLRLKRDGDLQAGGLAQAVLERYLSQTDWDARLARVRRHYARRADHLMEALRRRLPSWRFVEPEGGFSVWVQPDGDGDDAALLALSVGEGVGFDPGRSFRARPGPLALRLCFSSVDEREIDEGIQRLARAWAKLPAHDPGRARIGRRRAAARLRTLHPRPRPSAAAVDALLPPVGGAAARRRRGLRLP